MPPSNGADAHRVRTVVPHFKRLGWEPEILAVEPEYLSAPVDHWLCGSIPRDVLVHRSKAISLRFRSVPGLGGIDFRAFRALDKLGSELLSSRRFDLVYFSTTAFILTYLGPRWFKRFNVPYVVDYQDPWLTDYYSKNSVSPPGGKLKYACVQFLGKWLEDKVIRDCSGITSVSEEFPRELKRRYPGATEKPTWVAPFPASTTDFERVKSDSIANEIFSTKDGIFHWVYAGVIAPGMYRSLAAFFNSLKNACLDEESLARKLKVHFVGTSYAPAGTASPQAIPIANDYGVGHLVEELTDRIPYSQTLRCLRDADALLLFGSDEPAYAASKLMPYLLARKPMLAVLRDNCAADQRLREVGGASAVRFRRESKLEELSDELMATWFRGNHFRRTVPLNESAFYRFSDVGQAESLLKYFDSILSSKLKATESKALRDIEGL